jgi:hypothetical protein
MGILGEPAHKTTPRILNLIKHTQRFQL